MAPEDDHKHRFFGWRLGMVSKPRRCHEHPWRTDMLKKPTRVTHQALVSDQGLNIVVVFAHLGPLQAEALQQLASVGKTSRFWGLRASEREGFKGEWTRRLGANQHKNIEGRETQGVLGQTIEGMQWVEGNRKQRDWRRVNVIEWGEMQGVSQQKQGVLEQQVRERSGFEGI